MDREVYYYDGNCSLQQVPGDDIVYVTQNKYESVVLWLYIFVPICLDMIVKVVHFALFFTSPSRIRSLCNE